MLRGIDGVTYRTEIILDRPLIQIFIQYPYLVWFTL